MRLIQICAFFSFGVLALAPISAQEDANKEIVPLDTELGYWESTTDMGEMIKQMLSNLPESQRAQMAELMKGETENPVTQECVTAQTQKDFGKSMVESFGASDQCKLVVIKSTSTEFEGAVDCDESAIAASAQIHMKLSDSKHFETTTVSTVNGVEASNTRTVSEWKSATCPAGVE